MFAWHIYFYWYVHSNNVLFRLMIHDVADLGSSAIVCEEDSYSVCCLWQIAENGGRQTGYESVLEYPLLMVRFSVL